MAKNKDPEMPIVAALADFVVGRCSEEEYVQRVLDARGCIPDSVQRVLDVVHEQSANDQSRKILKN